ncbi:MAG: hypothetical protein V7L14_18420 [Nostoc sp.]|uniref:hypothetical protein n=1 Tax=Nostoc sp. TaxID=1180 RepID=UPI002FF865F0
MEVRSKFQYSQSYGGDRYYEEGTVVKAISLTAWLRLPPTLCHEKRSLYIFMQLS